MKYLLKVWFCSLILPPTAFWILIGILKNEKISSYPLVLPILITTIIMGFIFSIPLIINTMILNRYLINYFSEIWKMKMVINFILLVGIISIKLFLSEESIFNFSRETILPLLYLTISTISIWIFKYVNFLKPIE